MEERNIKLADFGKILFSRKLATKVFKERIEDDLHHEKIIFSFDFEGVDTVTHSFADELFKILFQNFGCESIRKKTSFENYSDFNEGVLTSAMVDNLHLYSRNA